MSLRRRLFLSVFTPIALLYLAFGIYGAAQTRNQLIDDLDSDLRFTSASAAALLAPLGATEIEALFDPSADTGSPQFIAVVDVATGGVILSPATEFAAAAQVPADAALAPSWLAPKLDQPITIDSADGATTYRAIATRIDGGRLVVIGHPLDRIDALTRRLVGGTIFTGAFLVAAMAAVVFVAIRSGLKPLQEFVATTSRVAEGDLSERVNAEQADPAFGRIAVATNHMLDEIQESHDQQRIGREQLNELIAGAAHELRTPLTAIRGTVDMNAMGMLEDPHERATAFAGLAEHSARMTKIVEDLIVLSRSENLRMAVQDDPASIVDLAAVARQRAGHFAAAHADYSIATEVADGQHEVTADETLLRTAIDQLLNNAIQHTPAGTAILLRVDSDDATVRLTVSDNGPGIPAEHHDRIFDRFTRTDRSRARTTGGSGLGLSIVRSIAQSAGGTVAINSHAEVGCELTLSLPRFERTPRTPAV